MEPIVDGLEAAYGDQIEFRNIDANSKDGRSSFLAYNLRGHPAFVLINPTGDVLWSGLGVQPKNGLSQTLQEILSTP